MPSVYDLKSAFQSRLRPMVAAVVRAGVTPNQMTLLALLGSFVVGAGLLWAPAGPRTLLVLPAWLLARMALNAMDGMAAREHGMTSRAGGALNEVGDVLSDLALYLPLAVHAPSATLAVFALTLGALLTEFCGVLGPSLAASRRYDGPMGKSDRALLVGLMALVGGLFPATLEWWPALLWAAAALTLLTCWNRVSGALREGEGSRS